jgi:class 3 adenylate cyclase/tetratricopeptide (TPR) repeat protein
LNAVDENFCGGCGVRLVLSREVSAPVFNLSDASSSPLLTERTPSVSSSLEAERKQVTVLFADVKGSMELILGLDPEEVHRLLDAIVQRMMEAVRRYEGTVTQVMGDGIMALFGAPIAHEDHPVRAGYAALRMQEAIAVYADQLQKQQGISLQIRVGLSVGEVVVGEMSNDIAVDYIAIGSTTHFAARMEQLATPGTIQATEAFARLTEGYLHCKSLGLVSIKGVPAPVEVFELIGAEPRWTRLQVAAIRGLTRFVGRQAELASLRQALEQAGTRQGQIVGVIGELGVGKSRLVYEFIDAHLTPDWLILETGSMFHGPVNPYLPLRELLSAYFQIDDRDDEQHIREKVEKHLTFDMALGDALLALLALLGVSVQEPAWQALDPDQRRLQTIEGVKRLLIRQSQVRPLLLIFENLHWIDAGTQALLDSLVESLPTTRLLLLVNYRPEYQHQWSHIPYYTQLRLDPLTAETAEELLQDVLGDAANLQSLKRLLIERTEGNPFFLEESIRTLVEMQVLVGEPGAYRLTQAISTIQVPAQVHAILAARIDRLPTAEKHLLQAAAVIGKDMSFSLLQAITDMPEEHLHRALAHLQSAELLYQTSLFPELEYTFKHVLTREVAYASLLRARRCGLHARIVDAIETLYAKHLTAQVERLAHHAFDGEVWEKALVYFRQAGTQAASHSAYQEAVTCFEQALTALEHLPEGHARLETAFELRMELRAWLTKLGDSTRILDNLREAEAIAAAQGDIRRLCIVCAHMSLYYRGMADNNEQAILYGERALALATELGDFSLQVLARQRLAGACHDVGDYRRAVQLLEWNISSLKGELVRERFGTGSLPAGQSRSYMAISLVDLGKFAEAVSVAEEAVRIANEADTAHGQVIAAYAVGLAYLCKGDFDRAIPQLEQTLHRCRVVPIPLNIRLLASALGYAYALSGRLADGVSLLEQAVQQAEALRVFSRYALLLVWLGKAYQLANRMEAAQTVAERAFEHTRLNKERGHQAYALWLRGEIITHEPDPDVGQAETTYLQAFAIANELGMRPLQAHCHLGLGTLYRKVGLLQQARTELSVSIELFDSMEMTFWLRQAHTLLAEPG